MISCDVLILGAGAAGLMCGIEAGRRGRSVQIIDHAPKPAEKIRISGGGRCNFTNLQCDPKRFLSQNPHFCVSALKRFTQHDFLARVEAHGVAWHEKTLGQLFCDTSARAIIDMLLDDLRAAGGELRLGVGPGQIERTASGFRVGSTHAVFECQSLVIATGGKSIPKMGATGFAYDVARQFGLRIVDPRPGLVPFTLTPPLLDPVAELSGLSVEARVACADIAFDEALLFTHRGLSGPSALQASSYWREGESLTIDLARGADTLATLQTLRKERPRLTLPAALETLLPKRLAAQIAARTHGDMRLADLSDVRLREIADAVHRWSIKPAGTEGWRTAEVTVGGVDTRDLSSRTLQANTVPGLYFVGECVDVTGWLGGYNFQWAWSSGWAAGQEV
jgi:predicted Rossmann fold flavoprotein